MVLALILANKFLIVSVLFGISEALAQIPSVNANSVFQAAYNGLKFAKGKLAPASDSAQK